MRKNAEQLGLTGVCVFHPSFSLVIVEGSSKSVKAYSRLMLVRIPWTESSAPREGGAEEVKMEEGKGGGLEDNRCDKVWEGPLRDRMYPNGFKAKSCPTDGMAKEVLGEKMASYWDVAKAYVREEDL